MKKTTLFIISLLLTSSFTANAQKGKAKELTPSRGHYKQLATFNSKPKSSNEKIDEQKFPTDKETVERRLSLKPFYLEDVTVDDFKIPDVLANSSDQTRAEINYLFFF